MHAAAENANIVSVIFNQPLRVHSNAQYTTYTGGAERSILTKLSCGQTIYSAPHPTLDKTTYNHSKMLILCRYNIFKM